MPIQSFALVAMLCATVIAAISLIDDLRTLSSLTRLAVHISAAAVVSVLWVRVQPLTGASTVVVAALATIWLVGVTNAVNFMDGIDGIAGGQAIVAGTTILILAQAAGDRMMVILATAIVGGSAGFLMHNWPPARVFMGDVGSAWLGFVFAAAALELATHDRRAGVAAAFVLWPFVFDTALTLALRAQRRENLMQSHRSHLYQRLVGAGASHGQVAIVYVIASALCGFSGIAWSWHLAPVALPLTCAALIAATLIVHVHGRERRRLKPARPVRSTSR